MRAAKVQASLRIRAGSPEPPLLAHSSSESRGTFKQKARSLAPLNGWACAVEICHNGMLEDTNSLDAAHMNSHYTPIKHNDIDDQLFTCNWPAVVTLIINTITQSGKFDYTQSVCSGAFVTLVIEHCLTAFFDVSNHQHSLISVTAFSKLVSDMSNSVRGYLNSSMSFPNTCTCKL